MKFEEKKEEEIYSAPVPKCRNVKNEKREKQKPKSTVKIKISMQASS